MQKANANTKLFDVFVRVRRTLCSSNVHRSYINLKNNKCGALKDATVAKYY